MSQSKPNDRSQFWQAHITAWQTTGQSQKAYCHTHRLSYSAFGYWVRKLRTASMEHPPRTTGFVPVSVPPVNGGLILSLPNGAEIRGIEADNLGLLRDLLGVLA